MSSIVVEGKCTICSWAPDTTAELAALEALVGAELMGAPGATSAYLAGRFEEHARHTGHDTEIRITFLKGGSN